MSKMILTINFKFDMSVPELAEAFAGLAPKYAEVPGLEWKVWSLNAEESEFCGIYLFTNEGFLNDLLNSELTKMVVNYPGLSDFSVKQFGVVDEFSKITRAPI
ncbi:MAG: YdhR family protein [Chloroflexota bacterium]